MPAMVALAILTVVGALGSADRLGPPPAPEAPSGAGQPMTPDLATSAAYQPDLGSAESERAIAIARADLDADPGADPGLRPRGATGAVGHAILAYPADADRPFFADRIVYVTFHRTIDADPFAAAWVDLTAGSVVGRWGPDAQDSHEAHEAPAAVAIEGIGLLGDPGPRVQWGGWSMSTEVSALEEGLALRELRFNGHLIAAKLSMPVMTVVYAGAVCGPFADRIGRPLLDVGWADGRSMVYRQVLIDGEVWRELGVRNQIGDYDLYQSYLFSANGSFEARLSGSGLQCLADHEHHPTFFLDADIDGPADDQVAPADGGPPASEVDGALGSGWSVTDLVTGTRLDIGPALEVVPGPASGGLPATGAQLIGVRRYRSAEDAGWRWGAKVGYLPYADDEALAASDVAVWYQARMPHRRSDGAAHWHTTGMRLTVTVNGRIPDLAPELNGAAIATVGSPMGAIRG